MPHFKRLVNDPAFTWLASAGIDRSTAFRGIAVVDGLPAPRHGVAIYRPVTDYLLPAR